MLRQAEPGSTPRNGGCRWWSEVAEPACHARHFVAGQTIVLNENVEKSDQEIWGLVRT
jgi:hypothetical protein